MQHPQSDSPTSVNSSSTDGGDIPENPLLQDIGTRDADDADLTPMPPSSPATTMTTGDDDLVDPPISPYEQHLQQLKSQQRRPGLGVSEGEDSPRNENGPPSPEEAREALGLGETSHFNISTLVAGETVHLLALPFYEDAYRWLNEKGEQPRMVDNRDLFELYESIERPGRTRANLKEAEDFVYVSTKTWNLLMEWFGGGPCLTRKCVNDNGRVLVDLRGLELKVKRSSRPNKFVRHVFSRYDTVGAMKRAVVEEWIHSSSVLEPNMYRVWDYYSDKCAGRLHPDSAQLASFRLMDGQSIMFEEADAITGEFKWDPENGEDASDYYNQKSYGFSSSSNSWSDPRRRRPENSIVSRGQSSCRGAVGLSNLGNTCFMNSTLQCLSNIWLLRNKFVSGEFERDLNPSNPLGTGGKLAKSFGDLMRLIWGAEGDVISPGGFKSIMAEFKPEFSGYQQHDSQELLSFLLDGLHEDLNRVLVKPITTSVEAKGRPDHEVAADSRRTHRLRNDSFVNDLFEGFYKSTVVCPDCHQVSVTFDPFTIVQLPVSKPKQTKMVSLPVAVLSGENNLPFRSSPTYVKVPNDAYMYDVRTRVCANQSQDFSSDDFILCSVYRDKIDKILSDFDKVDKLGNDDELIAFQDPNAKRMRLTSEAILNGVWHRPIFPSLSMETTVENAEKNNNTCPFQEGDVWIGTLENRKYRIRMQVSKYTGFGCWKSGISHRICCILDVSPTTHVNSYHEKRDGIEENAYVMHGYINPEMSSNNCKFELNHFLGSFGSFTGDYPLLSDRTLLNLIGTCNSRNFCSGNVEEQQAYGRGGGGNSYYHHHHHVAKLFCLTRVDEEDSNILLTQNSGSSTLPKPPPTGWIYVTLHQKRNHETIGQPSVFIIRANTTKQELFEILLKRLNSRCKKRDRSPNPQIDLDTTTTTSQLNGGTVLIDPYELRTLFRVIQRLPHELGGQSRILDEIDEEDLVIGGGDGTNYPLILTIEWNNEKLLKDSNLYTILFDSLYMDGHDDGNENGERMNKLYDCFDMFSEEEKLDKTETWYCSNCKGHKEAFKKMEFWEFPQVLVVHLKRFSQSQSSYLVDKDDTDIDFPIEGLDLRRYAKNPTNNNSEDYIYDLVSVSHHYGGLGGGHYIAHARNQNDGYWYEFDDSIVRPLGRTTQEATSRVKGGSAAGSAYVLFYVKRSKILEHWTNSSSSDKSTSPPPPPPSSSDSDGIS